MKLPQFVQIEPVGQCNLACRMCPVVMREEKPPAFMPFEAFCRLVDQFPTMKELQLQGLGEPLLHPRFFDMVRYAAAKGVSVSTNTNLTALSPRRAAECVASGLRDLYVSLDAADPAAYEYIRVGARFDRVVRNLGLLQQAKRDAGAPLPEIHLVAVAMRRNLEELPRLVRFAHAHGIRAVWVQQLCHDFSEGTLPEKYRPMRAFIDREMLAGEERGHVERWFEEARATAQALGVSLKLPSLAARKQAERPHPRCNWPWNGAYIAYSGEAMPCCMVATPDRVNFGNMAREGVIPVWDNEAYRRFRERLATEDDPPEICRGCAVYHGVF